MLDAPVDKDRSKGVFTSVSISMYANAAVKSAKEAATTTAIMFVIQTPRWYDAKPAGDNADLAVFMPVLGGLASFTGHRTKRIPARGDPVSRRFYRTHDNMAQTLCII